MACPFLMGCSIAHPATALLAGRGKGARSARPQAGTLAAVRTGAVTAIPLQVFDLRSRSFLIAAGRCG
jgi:hypothetical protein